MNFQLPAPVLVVTTLLHPKKAFLRIIRLFFSEKRDCGRNKGGDQHYMDGIIVNVPVQKCQRPTGYQHHSY